jgi:hypothetical protein
MKGQRVFCDQGHPGGDVEADDWCERYHWVRLPEYRSKHEPVRAVGQCLRCHQTKELTAHGALCKQCLELVTP